jgi:hypothetical protein
MVSDNKELADAMARIEATVATWRRIGEDERANDMQMLLTALRSQPVADGDAFEAKIRADQHAKTKARAVEIAREYQENAGGDCSYKNACGHIASTIGLMEMNNDTASHEG